MMAAAPVLISLLLPLSCSTQRNPPQRHEPMTQTEKQDMDTYTGINRNEVKVGLFVAGAAGVFVLMAAVYCIYTKFYTKQQYLHAQLDQETDMSLDPGRAEIFCDSLEPADRRMCYGSLSVAPSIISVPPSLSPPPSYLRFPPRFFSSHSLRTISVKDLEKSYI